jgi:CRP-like cAMP-binding protein
MDAATPATLRRIPLFADLGDEELVALADRVGEFTARTGQVLIEIGQPGSGLFVIEEGELTVELPAGATVRIGPGEFVGELALLTDDPHHARVRAATDVRCLAIGRTDFTSLLDEHPRVAVAMLPVLARRLAGLL